MVMIACMIGFGVAMEKSGAANYVSELVVRHVSSFGPLSLLAAFFVFTVVLTQPMSNQAAALVVLPVAIAVSRKLQLNPRAFVMAVTFAASCSFLTPLEPSCVSCTAGTLQVLASRGAGCRSQSSLSFMLLTSVGLAVGGDFRVRGDSLRSSRS